MLTGHSREHETKPEVTTPRIALRQINLNDLGDVDDNPEAVQFRVTLSETPTEGWIQEFDQYYRQTPYTLKPPVQVVDNTLEIIYLPRYSNELQGFFQFLGLIVQRANEELHRTEELHISNAQERRKAQFREVLRKIHVPQERYTSPSNTSAAGPVI